MARSRDVSPVSIPLDDIALERISRNFDMGSLGITDAHDDSYSRSKAPSYRVTNRESVLGREALDPDGLLIPRKRFGESRNSSGIHWLYPIRMTITLLAGLLLAIGHHIYYSWLDGRVVGSATKQQWALR
jgi:hypothetical protein